MKTHAQVGDHMQSEASRIVEWLRDENLLISMSYEVWVPCSSLRRQSTTGRRFAVRMPVRMGRGDERRPADLQSVRWSFATAAMKRSELARKRPLKATSLRGLVRYRRRAPSSG